VPKSSFFTAEIWQIKNKSRSWLNHVAFMLHGGFVVTWKPLEMLGSVLHHVAMKKRASKP
jgi:hypothetical protein